MDAQPDPCPDPHGRTLADAYAVIGAEHDRIADELLAVACDPASGSDDDALVLVVQRAGEHAWVLHHWCGAPAVGESGDLDALRVAYDDAVARRDRDAIAAASRRIVEHHIAHPDVDR